MPLIDIPKEFLTDEIFKSGFRGIFVGGCIERKEGSRFRAMAHAHYVRDEKKELSKYGGYICVLSYKRLYKKNGLPSNLLWHEIVHILTNHGHDDVWRKKMKELHQPIQKQYKRKTKCTK